MDTATLIRLFGTDEPLPVVKLLTAGALAVEIAAGTVRSVRWHGTEILRGIDYPIRDADWGTYRQTTLEESEEKDDDGFRYKRRFRAADGAVEGVFSLAAGDGRIEAGLELRPGRTIEVNRAGFVVLHPVAGLAGSPLDVTHSDGRVERTMFPVLISPGQPVFEIAGLSHSVNDVVVDIAFEGDTFEMEDQRNWSDASYKTYCRPLSLPYPYSIGPDAPVSQSIVLTISGNAAGSTAAKSDAVRIGSTVGRLPEVTLSLEPGWEAEGPAIGTLAVAATRLRLDAASESWRADLDRLLPATVGALDLEIVVPDEPPVMEAALAEVAAAVGARKLSPRMVVALPAAYLKSYQPDAEWPSGATPAGAAAAVRQHFPRSQVMGGMLTNFTELNRHRAAATSGDVLTHGTTAIVHAADDVSVMQTLEALPYIFRSAAALAPGTPYHLGLVAIGMRSNPYGAGLAHNTEGVRRPMADADPRQRGQFAAAWMVGAVAATEGSGVAGLSLATPAGPMGLVDGSLVRPAYHVFRFLAQLSTAARLSSKAPSGIAAVAARDGDRIAVVLANLTAEARPLALRGRCVVLPLAPVPYDWLDTATPEATDEVELGPYGVAFAWLDEATAEHTP